MLQKKINLDSCEANQIELSLASDLMTMNSPTLEIPTTNNISKQMTTTEFTRKRSCRATFKDKFYALLPFS